MFDYAESPLRNEVSNLPLIQKGDSGQVNSQATFLMLFVLLFGMTGWGTLLGNNVLEYKS